MSKILVGYDLNNKKNYAPLIEYLNSTGTYWHHLDSTWIIETPKTPMQVCEDVMKLVDGDDEVLVIDITGDPAAWSGFNANGSSWLKTTL